jgi:hypothetical protein
MEPVARTESVPLEAMASKPTSSGPGRQALRWLCVTIAVSLAVNVAIAVGLVLAGLGVHDATRATAYRQSIAVLKPNRSDSWEPMALVLQRHRLDPSFDLYKAFLEDNVKFQYPPSSLLLLLPLSDAALAGMRASEPDAAEPMDAKAILSSLAVLLTIACSALIFVGQLGTRLSDLRRPTSSVLLVLALAGFVGLTFYPLQRGHQLGQVQVYIGLLVAVGLLAYVLGYKAFAGACIGLCCLIKPQYAVLAVWAVLRGERRFVAGLVGSAAPGLLFALAHFGWSNHLRYLEVLSVLSRQGEAYWPNQSVNGVLNRFLENGSAIEFTARSFPSYMPFVHYATLLSSLALLALALWPGRRGKRAAELLPLDLGLAVVCATIASPVAWEHHYGTFLPVFALAVPVIMRALPVGSATAPLLLVSYTLVANAMLRPEILFANRFTGLIGAHLFWGALTFFALLLAMRSSTAGDTAGTPHGALVSEAGAGP